MRTDSWPKDDRIDWLLFRSQLDGADFFGRGLLPEESDPQAYVNESSNAVFSLLKKEYARHRVRAMAAAARLEQVPAMLTRAKTMLTHPVKLYAQLAIDAARGGDDLFTQSLMVLADSLSPADKARLTRARDGATQALHDFADWLDKRKTTMPDWKPMGVARYAYLLKNVLLLPLNSTQVANVPKDQAEFLAAYELSSWLEPELKHELQTSALGLSPGAEQVELALNGITR
jgi:hypothetical protein